MAEPQSNTQQDQSRAKENAGHAGGARGEVRSFDQMETRHGEGGLAHAADRAAPAAADGGRQIAETGRRAGQQVAEAMRQSLDPFLAMQSDMNRWFDDLWRQTVGFRPAQALQSLRPFGSTATASLFGLPAADLQETDDAHVLSIELPGLNKDDVDIGVDGDMLTISGHKAEETHDASATYRVSERRFGRFERSFPLPPDVDRGKIEAQFRDGLLKITLPRDPRAKPRRAKVQIKG